MEGLVGILPETGLAEAVTLGTAEVAAGRTLPLVIEAGEGRTAFLAVLPFVAVAVVEAPGTEAVLAERPAVIVTARAEGPPSFFSLAVHETVATGTEGTFVLTIPAEGGPGLRGLVTVTGGIGEGPRAEGLVHILPEAGLAETVAVGTAEIAAGCLVPFAVETGKGRLAVFPEITAAFVPGSQTVSAAAFVAPALGGVFPAGLAVVAFARILGIGMGVDANVITAERIKEELSKNKTLDGAVKSGFKMGLTPIIDGNVTIVIVAAILMGAFGPTDGFWAKVFNPIFFWFGPSTAGTIYSFGFTLLTSVLLNFVFGVWATRVMIRGAVNFKPLRKAWLFGGRKDGGADFKTPSINFIGNRKKFYTFSCALLALVLVFCGVFGGKMDVEFKGGAMITLAYEGDADLNDLKSTISTELNKSNLTLQTGSDISGNQTLTVTLPGSDTLTTEELDDLLATLNEQYPDNAFVQNEVSNVDATIGKEFMLKSIVALVAACVLILLYVAYRFRRIGGLKAGSTAIVALLHDMLVVFGVFVILRIPLNGNFIAALLTILGYSINDTVVIYDRIRENSALYSKKQLSLAELVNLSINQSFARSLMTSITTCLALGVVCIISVIYRLDSIYSFAFPLLFGMVSGVYSTICIATPLWVDWKTKKKAAKQA